MADQSLGNESGQMMLSLVLVYAMLSAAPQPAAAGPIASYTATSANVSGAPDAIRIDILRWSSEAERDSLMDAWNLKPVTAGRGRAGRGGRGASAEVTAPPTPE